MKALIDFKRKFSLCTALILLVLIFLFVPSIAKGYYFMGKGMWDWHEHFYETEKYGTYERIYTRWNDAIKKESSSITHLTFKSANIVYLPEEIKNFTNVEEIDFSYCNRIDIDKVIEQLAPLKKLIKLNFRGANVTHIPPAISRLKSLKYINFQECRLREVPAEIGLLIDLEILSFASNSLAKYATGEYYEITGGGNRIILLPPEIRNLTKLKILDIQYNLLRELPREIGYLKNLEILNLRGNLLIQLPDQLGYCSKLEKLDLSSNFYLRTLPESFAGLDSLTYLRVEGSRRIFEWGTNIFPLLTKMQNLKMLIIPFNSILLLPQEIGDFDKLETLVLYGNQFITVPPEIGKLKHLKVLQMNQGYLTELPHEIGYLRNLEYLDIHHNAITLIPKEVKELNNLKHMYICGNPIPEPHVEELQELLPDATVEYSEDCR